MPQTRAVGASAKDADPDKQAARAQEYAETPCGVVGELDFQDLADDGIRDHDKIISFGDGYYIWRLWPDVIAALTIVADDFRHGKLVPDDDQLQNMLCSYVRAGQSRLPDEYVKDVLGVTFENGRIDELMNSLAAIFDAFERCSCTGGQPDAASPWMWRARRALVQVILETQRVCSEGAAALPLVVSDAGTQVIAGLNILGAPDVQCYAGVRKGDGPIPTLAKLTGQQVTALQTLFRKAYAVRTVARVVAGFPFEPDDLGNLRDADREALVDPVIDFNVASGGVSAGRETWIPSETRAELERRVAASPQTGRMAFG